MARMLIIDDDATLREAIRALLESGGLNVTLADDGIQAIGSLPPLPADIVLCDMYMSGEEGIETITDLYREFPGVKIIANEWWRLFRKDRCPHARPAPWSASSQSHLLRPLFSVLVQDKVVLNDMG